jgi:HEPN domain-containing protein
VALCEASAEYDPGFAELTAVIKNLDQFHRAARFPDALPDGTPAEFYDSRDGEGAMEMARAVFGAVKGRLEAST